MKRIIDGKTYNTDTSTLVARSWWNDMQEDLYVTRGGAFFGRITEPGEADRLRPIDRESVDEWLAAGEIELLDNTIFAEPEEAAAEREPEATIYVRVPRSLRDRIDIHAKENDVSVNAWVMRCVERCCGCTETKRAAEALGRAFFIARAIGFMPSGYTKEQCHEALAAIENEIVSAWSHLDLPRHEMDAKDFRDSVHRYSNIVALDSADRLDRKWEPHREV